MRCRPRRTVRGMLLLSFALALFPRAPLAAEMNAAFRPSDGLKPVVAAVGFDHPLFLCSAPGDRRLFVVEQPGRIRWIDGGKPSSEVFLDISSLVSYGGERGMLRLASHPP